MAKLRTGVSRLPIRIERCGGACSHNISQAEALHSCCTGQLHDCKICADQWKQKLQGFIHRGQILGRRVVRQNAVAFLCNGHESCCTQQAAGDLSVQVMQAVSGRSSHWEFKPIKICEERVPVAAVCQEELLTDSAAYQNPNRVADEPRSDSYLSSDLSKDQKLFGFLPVLSADRFTGVTACLSCSDARCLCTSVVRSNSELPHGEGRGSCNAYANPRDNQGRNSDAGRTSTKQRCPGVPPHNAIALTRWPTCTEAIPPAHSLIPLWTAGDSAMAGVSMEPIHG